MADLLAQERATEQHVLTLLNTPNVTAADILAAFNFYRPLSEAATFTDFQNAEAYESRLWTAHGNGKRWFSRKLRDARKRHDRPVEERQWIKVYLQFLKQSELFYRTYFPKVNMACGGIPELETVAHQLTGDDSGESQSIPPPTITREAATASCHRILIYIGDLARYRATEKLDQKPEFGPAVGWYELAASLVPASGLGHHQQAVVSLERHDHLGVIYHFYRSIALPEPHAFGINNLGKEFEKTNAAWDRGELIQKGPPNDPDASKRALVGWFVRFHSMCYKGEIFRGHEELEREVLSQLSNVIKQRALDGTMDRTLQRMVLTNMAAQWLAGENYQANQSPERQQSFFYYFRFNLRTFTTLLQSFYDDLRSLLDNMDDQNVELAAKLTPLGRRILPHLRLYTNWLLSNNNLLMIRGLATEDFICGSVQTFWPAYARAIDLIVQTFPIWDLEDIDDVQYLLEEDVETREFKPVYGDETKKKWADKQIGVMKPCCNDKGIVRVSTDEEMLQRVKGFQADGLNLANDEGLPIKIRGTRIFCGDEENIEALVVRPVEYKLPPPQEPPKPLSYASAAANGHARKSRPTPVQRKASANKPQSRDAQLSRMVDDLLDDDDGNNPVTPPQQHASNPAVVNNGDVMQDSAIHDLQQANVQAMKNMGIRPNVTVTPPAARPASNMAGPYAGQHERMQSVSKLWDNGQPASSFPAGLPIGTPLASPMVSARGHSRGNSASSVRSLNADPRASDSAPRTMPGSVAPQTMYGGYSSLDQAGMGSPLLFGAGGSLWSTAPRGYANVSPPNGQGG